MNHYRREGTELSSLIEPTFALESQNKTDRALYGRMVNYMNYCLVHTNVLIPNCLINTDDMSSGFVYIAAF